VTVVPTKPVFGLSVSVAAPGTVKGSVATSPVGVPVTMTAYVPLAPDATVNEPDIAPPATVHSGFEIRPVGEDVIVQPVSAMLKLEPEMRTFCPARPEVGVNEMPGVTVKLALPESPSGTPLRVTV
jgi:hypothetical protein